MTPKEKAKELIEKYIDIMPCLAIQTGIIIMQHSKQCAIIAVENEYKEKRELLFLLRANKVIESEKIYLYYIQLMIDEENELKQEIEKL